MSTFVNRNNRNLTPVSTPVNYLHLKKFLCLLFASSTTPEICTVKILKSAQ